MTSTYFYVDGKPISAEEFLKRLFDTIKLPELLESEERLRELWANPVTRRELLQKLEGAGCHKDDLEKIQELIMQKTAICLMYWNTLHTQKSPCQRAARVETNKDNIYNILNAAQREFVDYVLRNYVAVGVDELDIAKLSTVIEAKYGSIDAAQKAAGCCARYSPNLH